jgi:hypothetical protein
MSDDNLQVRAKASWALGNLCAPASNSSSSSSLAASAAASHHFPLQQQNVIQTVFPFGNEPTTRCIWSPSQCASVTAAVVAADDSHLNVLAPLELYNGVGSSQSMLLSLLSLHFGAILQKCSIVSLDIYFFVWLLLHFRCNLNCSKLKAMNEKVIWKY